MFGFECVILFIHISKRSPVKFFNAPKRRKSVVKILNLIKHPMSCFEYIILFILITNQSQTPVYHHISGVYNTRVFFGVIIHEIHRAVQEVYDSSYAMTHVWASMAFRSHFSISGHHTKHYFVHNVLLY